MHALNSCVGDTWQRLWRDDFTHNGIQVVNRLKIPQGLSTLMFRRWSEVPSRRGVRGDSPWEKQTWLTKTWHFDYLFSVFKKNIFQCFIGNLLSSSSIQFLVVLFFIAFYTAPFSSKHFLLGLFLRSLSTQLFFLVVLFLLLLSMTAFSYVWFLSLFWVPLFHALYLSHLPPSSFLEGLSSEQFAELESVHLLAFSSGLFFGLPMFMVSVLSNLQGRFHILSSWGGVGWGGILFPFLFSDSVDFSYSKGSVFLFFSRIFFMGLLPCFSSFWFCSF